ncbi:MAG: hypothetical protein Q8T08_16845 [Ignavibacteria bacterium]|nr:hypothetical protein [Ignavibacteria bacterium]
MKRKNHLLNIITLCVFVFMSVKTESKAADDNRIYAGTAKVDYTPSSVPDSLINDHQFIRVIAFSDGQNKALLIANETQYTSNKLWEEMTKRIQSETGITPEYVVLSAIHTHSGVKPSDDFNDKMMSCVKEALSNLKPAKIGVGKGECLMNMSRRAPAASGGYWIGKNPYAPCDHEVAVLRVDDENGHPLSIMINWPAHAVINWPQPKLFSGDWPGATAQFVEVAYQNKITVPVSIGASGDINPIYWAPYEGDKLGTEDVGGRAIKIDGNAITAKILGEEVIRVANEIVTYPSGHISAEQRLLTLPGKKRFSTRMPDQKIEQGDDLQVRLTALKIGNIVFAGFGGEVMTEIGMHLKEQSPYKNTFVITHCNGSSGYLVTDEALKEGGYESGGSSSMPGCEKSMIDNLLEMISEL